MDRQIEHSPVDWDQGFSFEIQKGLCCFFRKIMNFTPSDVVLTTINKAGLTQNFSKVLILLTSSKMPQIH